MSTPEWARVGRHVRDRREELRLTQRRAAELAGISEQVWQKIETAGQASYAGRTLRGVEHALGWDVHTISGILADPEFEPGTPVSPLPTLPGEPGPADTAGLVLARLLAEMEEIRVEADNAARRAQMVAKELDRFLRSLHNRGPGEGSERRHGQG